MSSSRPRPHSSSASGPIIASANMLPIRCSAPMWTKHDVTSRHHSPLTRSTPLTAPNVCNTAGWLSLSARAGVRPHMMLFTAHTKNHAAFAIRSTGTTMGGLRASSGSRGSSAPVSAPPAWQKEVCCQKPSWTLTEGPITGGAAEKGKAAHWYDFGNDALIEARARNLAKRVTDAGYHGLFFDTPGFEHLPPVAQTVFRQRYPRMDYDERQGRFLAALRRALPAGKVLFTNQGYRHADHLLPHADFDLTESTFTGVGERGSTIFRPWHDPARAWESVRTPMYELILPTLRKFPKVRMVHVNYAGTNPADVHRAIQYGYAASLIFGHDSYLMAPAASAAEEDPIYFTDLGPAEDFWKEEPSGAVWRRFRHGIAVLNSATRRVEIPSLNLPTLEPQRGYIFPAKL